MDEWKGTPAEVAKQKSWERKYFIASIIGVFIAGVLGVLSFGSELWS
jgi:hypothetical protein